MKKIVISISMIGLMAAVVGLKAAAAVIDYFAKSA